ncbi:TetR/AcrR family transcriptional regulator [Streptomyces sp. NPDC055078]
MRHTRTESREHNRAALLASARRLVADEGTGVSLSAIARGADLTTGAVYSIFGSKSNLLVAVLADQFDAALARIDTLIGTDGGLVDTLRVYSRGWLASASGESVEQYRIELHTVLLATEDADVREQMLQLKNHELERLTELLTDRIVSPAEPATPAAADVPAAPAVPERRTSRYEAERIAIALRALLHGFALQRVYDTGNSADDIVGAACAALAHLIAPEIPEAPEATEATDAPEAPDAPDAGRA